MRSRHAPDRCRLASRLTSWCGSPQPCCLALPRSMSPAPAAPQRGALAAAQAEAGAFEAALALCDLVDAPTEAQPANAAAGSDGEEMRQLRRALHGRFAAALFADADFEAAMCHFRLADAEPLQARPETLNPLQARPETSLRCASLRALGRGVFPEQRARPLAVAGSAPVSGAAPTWPGRRRQRQRGRYQQRRGGSGGGCGRGAGRHAAVGCAAGAAAVSGCGARQRVAPPHRRCGSSCSDRRRAGSGRGCGGGGGVVQPAAAAGYGNTQGACGGRRRERQPAAPAACAQRGGGRGRRAMPV